MSVARRGDGGGRILVTGASGNTGAPLTALLADRGAPVRTATRRTVPPGGGEHVRFDWADPATHAPALAGADRVYLVAPVATADPAALVEPFLAAAVRAGVRHVVLLSSSAIAAGDPGLGEVEALVRSAVPRWAVLKPSWFMQNLTGAHPLAEGVRATGELVTATGDGRLALVDARDIAAVAAALLLGGGDGGDCGDGGDGAGRESAEYLVTGPEPLSYADAAALLTEVTGTPVRHVGVTAGELAARLTAAGFPPDFAEVLAGLDTLVRDGRQDFTADTVERLTGRPPRSLRAFLTEHRDRLVVPVRQASAAAPPRG
ncbi:ergot alkaloid biosynthesis protein [Streptomyces carminius]|uniref:Ergot alkaloid biosynthesis protein n=1 Tax=Streptomyces carminius TaxID=2665496 RepID=A0A2M8LT06_9ACTN|nr:NAD(P)H-binding protein [Streptomyces carminius]PJE95082.1 ergot alkaloid biosynthesis protein [Streptomyces carminius]